MYFFYHLLKNYTHLKVQFFVFQCSAAQMLNPCPRSQHICFIIILNEKSKVRRQGFYFFLLENRHCSKILISFFYFSLLSFLVLTSHCSKMTVSGFFRCRPVII